MSSITVHAATAIPFYEGPHAIPGIRFRHARQALGVSAWGMNLIDLDPGCTGYPEHDHTADGQEEVYLVLRGSGALVIDGTAHALAVGSMVRVPPEVTRTFTTDEGLVFLALGGTPGAAYAAPAGM